jgi:mannose-1-phosphate guanylyltransferase
MTPRLFPLILAGGSGTRFWPLSRQRRPKQLLPLSGRRPLIVETAARLRGLASPRDVAIVCGRAHAAAIRRLVPRTTILVEPAARNTAPCVGWAALRVRRVDPGGVLLVLPSDHHVGNPAEFRRVLRRCAEVASTGALCTVGLRPTRPETGYGYLKLGRPLGRGVFEVAAFVEKPDARRAARFLARGDHLWNGGIFAFRADAILAEIERQMPELWRVLHQLDRSVGAPGEAAALRRLFPRAPSVSLDYGVMEGARRVAVVPGDFGWSDLGSFAALPEVRAVDRSGNVVEGRAVLVDCADCVVLARKRPVAVVGMRGAVVVDAGDAVLVVPRDRCQDVREVVAALKRAGLHGVL